MKKVLCISLALMSHNIGAGVLSDLWNGSDEYNLSEGYSHHIRVIDFDTNRQTCLLGQNCVWTPHKRKPYNESIISVPTKGYRSGTNYE